ncbi:hypothetical protein [Ectobacillus ponti]|uniref:Uncharacterized protein n=1 Tax=Ectobacillus ponti TaxID=2961894 RepID=A0AA41X2T1_9BACI|nr:hypothetical protein [Ectobacillus ponti]MCP8967881.1 hypothetical protein [Ectobacillus ponti]
MASVLGILSLALLFIVYEAPRLRKQSMRELRGFYIALGISVVFSILYVLGVPIPNPVDGLIAIFEPVAGWVNNVLGVERDS